MIIPRYLPKDKLTLNALGLLQAEMTKGTKRKSCISFTNSEPNLINVIMKFFKRFGVDENKWSWNITFNFKLKREESPTETVERESVSEQMWIQRTKISLNMRKNQYIYYLGNWKYDRMWPGTMRQGSLRIDYSNIILFQVILKLLEEIKKILVPEPVKYYLQGIFAGEACVKPNKYWSLREINVGVTNIQEKQFYSNSLLVLGIPSSKNKNSITIHSMENFLEVYKNNLLSLHPKRNEKFLKYLSNFTQIPKRLKV